MELKLQKRDSNGLIEGVVYKYTEDGSIHWRAMINPKHLYVNAENFQRRGEVVPTSTEGVQDKDLISTLVGLRELADLRGKTSITYRPIVASSEYAAVVCQVAWVGNYETNMEPVVHEDCACATPYTTAELVQGYLLEMACNRALARAIRSFLKIGIVSKEELPPQKKKMNGSVSKLSPSTVLADYMKGKGRTFEETKKKLVAEGCKEFENYKDWADVPGDMAFNLLERFKNLKDVKR